MKKFLLIVPLFLAGQAFADHDGWLNRPNVLRTAEKLAEEVEHFDTELHGMHAPDHVIQKVHHFEDTVLEFVEEVRRGCTYQDALFEMNHIREDVDMIRDELYAHPEILRNPGANTEWKHLRTAYRYLDHEMYRFLTNRYSKEESAKIVKEFEELLKAH